MPAANAKRELMVLIAKRQANVVEKLRVRTNDLIADNEGVFRALAKVVDAAEIGLALDAFDPYFNRVMNETTQKIIECAHLLAALKENQAALDMASAKAHKKTERVTFH
jgi:uncharacterized protein YfbU (UPF0304 family)